MHPARLHIHTARVIGLTGGIATGKSTVRGMLMTRRNLEAFDADAHVHHLLRSNSKVAEEIRMRFGSAFIQSDGTPDRAALREVVFHDPQIRRDWEALLHPLVQAEWQTRRSRCIAAGVNFLADIPLLYETQSEAAFDAVIVVAASPAMQLARMRARGLTDEIAQAMLASQLPIGQKVARASFVVWNDGTLAALGRQIELLAKQLFAD